ncbi:ATP-dependent DNA helicase Q4 [Phytophthora pseudosyringae]|uniref:ATP-dependent DNA helicase Q4 n=1 Tax=Phytophthora pseudosyringae TaxID=221518 RepID=A0A8T1VZF7_9STRA|nr:ATP-dependent DNA helicase Q4 [Phytophthora pseudosyringae]
MVRSFGTACAFAGALAVAAAQPSFVYKFDAERAAGVDGSIQIKYAGENSSSATITASLDFSRVNQSDIVAFDNNCTMDAVTGWKWHIHTKWNSTQSSESFKQCAKAATASHYDPLRACGPVSEYNAEPECTAKIKDYACNPANYSADPLTCEKGDLSGKFGAFKLAEDATVAGEWTDEHFPLPSENTESWSIVLHAMCGQESRIACAHRTEAEGDVDQVDQSTPVQDTPEQSTAPSAAAGCGV